MNNDQRDRCLIRVETLLTEQVLPNQSETFTRLRKVETVARDAKRAVEAAQRADSGQRSARSSVLAGVRDVVTLLIALAAIIVALWVAYKP